MMLQRQPESMYLYRAEPETCHQGTSYTCSQQQGSYHHHHYHQIGAVHQQQYQQYQLEMMAGNEASFSEVQSGQLTTLMSRQQQQQQQQQQVKYDQSHMETVAVVASPSMPAPLANNDLIYKQQQRTQCSASLLSTPSAPLTTTSSSSSTSLLAHKISIPAADYSTSRHQPVSLTSPTTASMQNHQQQPQIQAPHHATADGWPIDGANENTRTSIVQSNPLPPTHWPPSSPITYVKTPPVSNMALTRLSPDVGSPPAGCDDLMILTPPLNTSTSSNYIGQQPTVASSQQQQINRTILLSSSVSPPVGASLSSSGARSVGGVGGRSVASPSGASSTISSSDSLANNLSINLEQYISKRNERERSRVRNVNDAFDNLKNSLPLEVEKLTKRMSKVEILRTAISYIKSLEDVLGYRQHHNYNDPHHRHYRQQQQQQQQQQQRQHNHNCADRALAQQQQQTCTDMRVRSGSVGSHMRRPEGVGRALWMSSANRCARGKSHLSVRKMKENSEQLADDENGRAVACGHYKSSRRRAAPGFPSSSSFSSLLSLNRCDLALVNDCGASSADSMARKSKLLKRDGDNTGSRNSVNNSNENQLIDYKNSIEEQRMATATREMSACCMDEPSSMKCRTVGQQRQQQQQDKHSMDESSQEQLAYEELINGFRCYSDDQLDDY